MTESVFEEQTPATEQDSAGAKLARAREVQDMSVADVARALRLSVKQIEALETNDYDKLPGRTFVRGFLRNYARLVNLDPDRLVMEYFPVQPEVETLDIQAPSQRISFSEHHSKPWLKWLATSFVVVALISWGVLVWLGPETARIVVSTKPTAPSVSALPAVTPAADTAETPEVAVPAENVALSVPGNAAPPMPLASVMQARLLLNFSGPAWVEVRDKSGKKIHSQNNPAGSQQTVEGEPPLSLWIGNAPNVKVTWKGRLVDLAAYTKADVARLKLE